MRIHKVKSEIPPQNTPQLREIHSYVPITTERGKYDIRCPKTLANVTLRPIPGYKGIPLLYT
jgi:hypothetical protein